MLAFYGQKVQGKKMKRNNSIKYKFLKIKFNKKLKKWLIWEKNDIENDQNSNSFLINI